MKNVNRAQQHETQFLVCVTNLQKDITNYLFPESIDRN